MGRFNQQPLKTAIPKFLKMLLLMMMVFTPALLVRATSVKMDFLSAGLVRTDPLMYSEIGECLSDHVHRFYGAVSNKTMRPEVSYEDLRNADGNSGNTEENLRDCGRLVCIGLLCLAHRQDFCLPTRFEDASSWKEQAITSSASVRRCF